MKKEDLKKTALIFFSYSAHKQHVKKRISSNSQKNQVLAQLLVKNTCNFLQQTDLQVFHFNEFNQVGASFGERLANAFDTVFSLGYENAISFGNDDLCFHQIDFNKLAKDFEQNQVLLGPTQLGGTYLIGLNRKAFIKEDFQSLRWNSSKTFSSLKNYFARLKTKTLDLHYEINEEKNLKSAKQFSTYLNQKIFILLTNLLKTKITGFCLKVNRFYLIQFFHSFFHRGPPNVFVS